MSSPPNIRSSELKCGSHYIILGKYIIVLNTNRCYDIVRCLFRNNNVDSSLQNYIWDNSQNLH